MSLGDVLQITAIYLFVGFITVFVLAVVGGFCYGCYWLGAKGVERYRTRRKPVIVQSKGPQRPGQISYRPRRTTR